MTLARVVLLALFAFCLSQAILLPPRGRWRSSGEFLGPFAKHSRIWVLLVAGSNDWYNYRHQADVCHAYHIMRKHGIHANNIITMMYDDIANNEENPYPGKIFNRPHGKDLYEGVEIDYRGDDVTPENFLAILQGNSTAVKGGNGRVIDSNSHDHIFVYFTDHGAAGLISFPDDILSVKDLNAALKSMHKRKRFDQLTFYLEACESGSMFEGVLPENIDVYAITAANNHESSWATYCDNPMNLPCLGDLFSVTWMEDSDIENLNKETLKRQFEIVKERTNLSHVMHYGDLNIANERVAEFQGWKRKGGFASVHQKSAQMRLTPESAWPSRDILPMMLDKMLHKEEGVQKRAAIRRRIAKLEEKREFLDKFMVKLVKSVIHDKNIQTRVLNTHPGAITQVDCHDRLVKAFHKNCFHFSQNPYALKHAFVLANLCEERIDVNLLLEKIMPHCRNIQIANIH